MRKTISLVLVAAMLLSVLVFVPTASAATLDEHNVQVDAQYFGGTLYYNEIGGNEKDGFYWYGEELIKDGNPDNGTLIIDGIIEEGEWTDKVYHIDSDYAPNNAGLPWGNNALFETPSAENTFYYWVVDTATQKSKAPSQGLEYDVRLMWDEDFFYMAVSYHDNDGYLNDKNANDDLNGGNWDSDSIQFRLDPAGPNAIVDGKGFDASKDSFLYDPEIHGDTDNTPNCTYPWDNSNSLYNGNGQETRSTIGNFIFSYHTANGYTELCDASRRYWGELVDVPQEDGTVKQEWKYYIADISPYGPLAEEQPEKITYAAGHIGEDTDRHPVFRDQIVQFEIALPWALVADDYAPEANAELGFGMVRFNTALGDGSYNSFLEWGTGVCNYPVKDMPQVVGGSNCLVLSEELAKDAVGCEHTFAEPTCIVPEKCTQCGYERGYVAGHEYVYSNESIPTEDRNGTITATCTVCADTYTQSIPEKDIVIWGDITTSDTKFTDQGWESGSGFTIQWETLDEEGNRYTDETDPDGTLRKLLWNDDNTAKTSRDTEKFGYAVADLTLDGQTGTYFASNNTQTSYAEKLDIYLTDLTPHAEGEYNNFIGNWFGGKTGVGYTAGLVEVEGDYYFGIYPAHLQSFTDYAALEEYAFSITPATAEQIATEVWHEYVFMYDNASSTALLFWDDELVASATDYHFYHNDTDAQVILRQFNLPLYAKDIVYGSTTLVSEYITLDGNGTVPAEKVTVTVNGVATEYDAGTEVTIEAVALYEENSLFYRFAGWTGDIATTESTYTFVAESDVTVEADYLLIGDVSKDGRVNAMDSNTMKRMFVGQVGIEIEGDLDNSGKVQSNDANLLIRLISGNWIPEE